MGIPVKPVGQLTVGSMRTEQGAALFRRLAATADVVIENFRPGTLERWGLGFADLLAINPRLVMLRVSAYGQTGPKSALPGFARIAQAYAGLSYLTGQPDTPPLIAGSTTRLNHNRRDYAARKYQGIMGTRRILGSSDREQERPPLYPMIGLRISGAIAGWRIE